MASRGFKNGTWEGSYQAGLKEKHTLGLQLVFTSGKLEGQGVDDVGGYVDVTGTWNDKPPYNAELRFKYAGGETVDFTGWREKERTGIFGTFKGVAGSGSFAIFPSTNPEKVDMEKLASQALQTLINNLKSMGFPTHLCEIAPQHVQSQDLEVCIEWITVQLDSDVPLAKPAASNTAIPSAEAIAQLKSMGFDDSQAQLALAKNDNNVERAVEWLFANS